MKPLSNTIRSWLLENGYADVAELIDLVMVGWANKGTKTRRNWWDVLAGDAQGNPKTIEGIVFPVLRAARIRKGWKINKECLCRNKKEIFPCKDRNMPVKDQVRRIRFFFSLLFVQNIVEVVNGEDEIWLLESGVENKLHIWKAQND